jgi:uncharacterized protein (DUF934 family)
MAHLIDRKGLRPDSWQVFDGTASAMPEGADVLVALDVWRAQGALLKGHSARLGLLLSPPDDVKSVATDLVNFALVAVHFPKFTDGRGYSTARLLRERLGWQGELRATGDVLRDQLFLMARCGFDSFALRDDQDPQAALSAFRDFSVRYQSATDEPQPLFRRRQEAA